MASANYLFNFLLSFCAALFFFFTLACSAEKAESLTELTHFHTVPLSSLLPSTHDCHQSPTHAPKGLKRGASSLKVVHKHGGCSKLPKGKSNTTPTLTQILNQDESRVNSIHARVNSARINKLDSLNGLPAKKKIRDSKATVPAKSGTTLGTGNYVVTVGLGTPKNTLTLVFDTGSDLTWTQCKPCVKSCYTQQERIFDPKLSTSYANITCTESSCSGLTSATGNNPGCSSSTCVYGIQYGDSSFSVGYFAKDRLSLTASDVVENFLFGCGQNNQGLFGNTAGLLGLGRDALSVVSQTASKYGKYFSYCLPTKRGANGHLTFGNGGNSGNVKFSPFANEQGNSFYFIDVQEISVGGKQLSIAPVVFKSSGMIIDSGTVITRLPPAAYTALKSAFKQGMSKYPSAPGVSILDTCFDLSKYTTVSIPKISFGLNGGVTVDLPLVGILLANGGASQVCLAFAGNSDASDVGIFGNIQQQTFEVVYDVAGGKLGIGAAGCS